MLYLHGERERERYRDRESGPVHVLVVDLCPVVASSCAEEGEQREREGTKGGWVIVFEQSEAEAGIHADEVGEDEESPAGALDAVERSAEQNVRLLTS